MADTSSAAAVSLLDDGDIAGSVDHRGQPALRSSSGGWRSAAFIIGSVHFLFPDLLWFLHFDFEFSGFAAVEVAERFAYYGISSNLITYLTGPLGQSTAAAAENVNAWSGTGTLLPVVGAIVADSFLGRYTTIIVASVIYASGLGLLTLSAALTISNCRNSNSSVSPCSSSATKLQEILFFISLYMVAIGQGGHKPCAQAFGADQFDELHSKESVGLQEFFYEEVPTELKSLGLSFYLGVLGVGSFLSSFIVSLVDEITGGRSSSSSWFDDDLNKAHLDYFYWLLAVLSGVWFVGFLCSARTYVYRLK
ncbi:Protein NRT1/ PTR FAMILY 5.10 [Linum perenne]